MALEELLIKIKSIYDNDGFNKASTGLQRFKQGLSEADGAMGKLNYTIQNFGRYAAMAFVAVAAAIAAFSVIAIQKAMESEKGWAIFAGTIGATSPEIQSVKDEFSDLFTTIGRGTAQSAGAIRDAAGYLSLMGMETSGLATATKDVAVLANLRFGGDMTSAQEAYYKALLGNNRSLKNMGTTLEQLGYTQEQWDSMTLEQRAQILDTYMQEHNWMQANDNYLNTAAGKWQTINNEVNKAVTNFGYMALEMLNSSGVLDMIIDALKWFNDNKGAQEWVVAIVGIGTAILGIVSTLWVLTKMSDMFGTVKTAVMGALEKIGLLNATPCTPKECVTKSTTQCGGVTGGTGASSINPALAFGGAIAAVTGGGFLQQSLGKMLGLGQGQIDASNVLSMIPGAGPLSLVGAQAAGKQATPVDALLSAIPGGTMAKGLWETIADTIKPGDILGIIKHKVGFLKWTLPTAQQLVKMVSDFIAWLGWQIPTWQDLVKMVSDFIAWLGWQIPTWQDLVQMISGFIGYLSWSIPSAQDILDAVVRVMTGGGSAGGYGGDEASMQEWISISSGTNSTVTKTTISPVIHIGAVDSKETADYFVAQVTKSLAGINDAKGR